MRPTAAARSTRASTSHIGTLLRHWRTWRRLSQLDLALDAEISTRHLSYVETGRAQPSREMVLRLAEALQVPLRERNGLLLAAGYAPLYRQNNLDTQEMAEARRAVDFILAQLEPYPAIVVDRFWNVLKRNRGTERFLSLFPGCDGPVSANAIRLVFHSRGLRPFVENWEEVAARIIQRIHREAIANPRDDLMKALLDELLSYPGVPSRWRMLDLDNPPPPFLTIDYRCNGATLRLFSTIATFGSPQDVTLQDLKVECFFPADEVTRAVLARS